jgi:protein SCO1/2
MNKRTALRVLGLTAVAWGALALGGCSREAKTSFQGVDVTGAEYAKDIPLRDVDGKQRSLKDFAGKVVVVFFGYTQCPDVCPTTMQELVEVKQQLGADGDRLQGIFVTLDPERDTPEVL